MVRLEPGRLVGRQGEGRCVRLAETERAEGREHLPHPLDRWDVVSLGERLGGEPRLDRKSTRLNSSHANISYAVFCLKKNKLTMTPRVILINIFTATPPPHTTGCSVAPTAHYYRSSLTLTSSSLDSTRTRS